MSRWDVLRAVSTTQWFEGIEADSAEEAIQKYLAGEGELNPDRTQTSAWQLDAELGNSTEAAGAADSKEGLV